MSKQIIIDLKEYEDLKERLNIWENGGSADEIRSLQKALSIERAQRDDYWCRLQTTDILLTNLKRDRWKFWK